MRVLWVCSFEEPSSALLLNSSFNKISPIQITTVTPDSTLPNTSPLTNHILFKIAEYIFILKYLEISISHHA
jgi:hypothetical protein